MIKQKANEQKKTYLSEPVFLSYTDYLCGSQYFKVVNGCRIGNKLIFEQIQCTRNCVKCIRLHSKTVKIITFPFRDEEAEAQPIETS